MPDGMFKPVGEDRELVGPAVAVGVFEHLHAIAALSGRMARILEALGDPDAPALVEGHRHGVHDVGLARDNLNLKTGWHGHRPRRLGRGRAARWAGRPGREGSAGAAAVPSITTARMKDEG